MTPADIQAIIAGLEAEVAHGFLLAGGAVLVFLGVIFIALRLTGRDAR